MIIAKKIKIIRVLTIMFILFLLLGVGAVAASQGVTKRIPVVYRNIKVYVDGRELKTGEEPFILKDKGVAMVPLRFISEALGKSVTWVEHSSTIYIGTIPERTDFPSNLENLEPIPIEKLTVLRNVGPFYEYQSHDFLIAKRAFKGGVAVNLSKKTAEMVLDLKGDYNYLEGYLGVDDETMNSASGFRIVVYGDDVEIHHSPLIKPGDYPRYLKLDVRGVKRLRVTALREDIKTANGDKVGEYENVIAVLADFKFYK